MGGGSKAQKDKPEGPSHTPGRGWACPCSPPSRPASEDPLPSPQPSPGGEGTSGRGGWRELLPVVCDQIVPKLLNWRRNSRLQQQKTQTMNAPPRNKEERHYS